MPSNQHSTPKPLYIDSDEFQRWAQEQTADISTHVHDQSRAAHHELVNNMLRAGGAEGDHADLPRGIRTLLDRIARWLRDGQLEPCPHLRGPQPVVFLPTASYYENALVFGCNQCLLGYGALVTSDPKEDRTCDGCRSYCRGGLRFASATVGLMLVGGGFCGPCMVVSR